MKSFRPFAILLLGWALGCTPDRASFEAATGSPPSRSESSPAESSFLSRARDHIAAREYWPSRSDDGLQAPNRRHDLRTYFEPTGVRVHERRAGGSARLVELAIAGLGRGATLSPIGSGEVVHRENRVEIRREALVEWYENSDAGLEQGFTLRTKPDAETHGELVLELSVAGARARSRGESVVFESVGGRRLDYGKLVVLDDTGRKLAARLEAPSSDRVRLVVDDVGATYPIVIDPLIQAAADSLFQANQANSRMGQAVASAGDVNGDGFADVVVGAPDFDAGQADEGAAFVFLGSETGIDDGDPVSAHAQLESDQLAAAFGSSVASAGDVDGDGYDDVIVGAPNFDAPETQEGAAFVFLGSPTGVGDGNPANAHARLEADQAFATFGVSVASAGDVDGDGYADIVVGAESYDAGQADEGAAFVFLGSAAGLVSAGAQEADARFESDQASAFLGASVASAGDVDGDGLDDLIIGARRYAAGQPGEGAAFVFLGSPAGLANGNPASAAAVLESDQASAELGRSVAGAGDMNGDGYADVIVGAPFYGAGQQFEGAAFVFSGSAAGIVDGNPTTASTRIESDQTSAWLGYTVARAGDLDGDGFSDVVVGAFFYDDGQNAEGAAFVVPGSASFTPVLRPATLPFPLLASNQIDGLMGSSVAGAGDVNGDGFDDLIIGASAVDFGEANEGAAFVFQGSARAIGRRDVQTADHGIRGADVFADFGRSVASAGDVNGDGHGDVIIGAPGYDGGQIDEGAAFVFLGSRDGVWTSSSGASARIESDQAGAALGFSVASAGDVDGDGHSDVVVGAVSYDSGETDEGAAFVFLGSPTGIASGSPASAHGRIESNQSAAQLGISVASAGDLNADGFGDLVVGAFGYGAIQPNAGAAFVFLGSAAGIGDRDPASADTRIQSDQASAFFGASVASAGDVDGDGYGDLIVGASGYDAGQTDEGAAFVFHGSPSGIADGGPGSASTTIEGNQTSAQLGQAVSTAGDVDADGFADVIVGASNYSAGQAFEGAAFVFRGSTTGLVGSDPATAHARLESDQSASSFGRSVAAAGDVDGDGFADVIVGAFTSNIAAANGGAAFLFRGSAAGIANGNPSTASAILESSSIGANFGVSVAGAGDVNGDGFADLIGGTVQIDVIPGANGGAAFVFYGNSDGRPVLSRQRRGDGSGIGVAAWGRASSETGFAVELLGSHPAGNGRLRGEFEVCPEGAAFGSVACTVVRSPDWVSVSPADPDPLLRADLDGLAPQTLHRWRARVLRADATGPIPAHPFHGPWRRPYAQVVEADIRTLPEPGLAAVLGAGCLLIGVWKRRSKSERLS